MGPRGSVVEGLHCITTAGNTQELELQLWRKYSSCNPAVLQLVYWNTAGVLEYSWCIGIQLVYWNTAGVLEYNRCIGIQLVYWNAAGVLKYSWCIGIQLVYWNT